jgi:hypothetical protein
VDRRVPVELGIVKTAQGKVQLLGGNTPQAVFQRLLSVEAVAQRSLPSLAVRQVNGLEPDRFPGAPAPG